MHPITIILQKLVDTHIKVIQVQFKSTPISELLSLCDGTIVGLGVSKWESQVRRGKKERVVRGNMERDS